MEPIGGSLLEVSRNALRHDVRRRHVCEHRFPNPPALVVVERPSALRRAAPRQVLHSFGGGDDAQHPWAGLVHFGTGTTLYGTTFFGGIDPDRRCYDAPEGIGCGTVFSITTSGTEKVMHSFGEGPDGKYPEARLLPVHGAL